MELILLQKVAGLGGLGEKVKVRAGYGRNYLIPYGKAVPATADNLAEFEQRRSEYEARANEALDGAQARRTGFEDQSVTIPANASTEGKLYGSIGPREIAQAFTEKGLPLEKSEVILGEGPIRLVGEHQVLLHLHADVEVPVKVTVIHES
ncbi:MAG TPA: 50S ribosomal protein L9 [Xanthomonadaceae bacterium]|nr:50S ribosomal protein L9 [Xanthomonadaceae bacterium]